MTYLFIYAHPDDESVASAGTMKQLIENGDIVVLVSVTDGGAGELDNHQLLEHAGVYSVGELRRKEFMAVARCIGVNDARVWEYSDGEITNKTVWGKLSDDIVDLIEEVKPDVVVTFDHSGWYFHLDHVGVSIATTLAYQQSSHRPQALLLAHYRVDAGRWKYIFADPMPVTHRVDVTKYRDLKQQCYELHASQQLNSPRKELKAEKVYECFQAVLVTEQGKQTVEHNQIFQPVV